MVSVLLDELWLQSFFSVSLFVCMSLEILRNLGSHLLCWGVRKVEVEFPRMSGQPVLIVSPEGILCFVFSCFVASLIRIRLGKEVQGLIFCLTWKRTCFLLDEFS